MQFTSSGYRELCKWNYPPILVHASDDKSWYPVVYGCGEVEDPREIRKRMERLKRDLTRVHGYRCFACLERMPVHALSVHHIRPRGMGGTDAHANLALLCHECHNWAEELGWSKFRTRGSLHGVFSPKGLYTTP